MIDSIRDASDAAAREHGWAPTDTKRAAVEYERFVTLATAYPHERLVPSSVVDAVWHHHLGNDGAPPHATHSTPDRDERFGQTLDLYVRHFGEAPGAAWDEAAECQVDEPVPDRT